MSAVIVGYARTPFVKFGGVFSSLSSTDLGAHAARAALDRAGIAPDRVDITLAGQVLLAGAGQNPARQTAVGAGLPLDVPAMTINIVCLSGSEAVAQADRLISAGEASIVLVVGQESMTQAPHLVQARMGQRYGAMQLVDSLEHDGLSDSFEHTSMGALTEGHTAEAGISRERQDEWAARSHRRLAEAHGMLADEIVPLTPSPSVGEISADDGLRADTTAESLARLRPAFSADGTVTAGNASQISDGAAALVIVDESLANAEGLPALARIESRALVAGPGLSLLEQPSRAILAALDRAGLDLTELTAVEINEAFASVAIRSTDVLGVDESIVNAHGGAIALGHPIGASGARLVGHLARTLAAQGTGSLGVAALCGGGGQGSAIVLRAL
ncbi:MAG: acetyl-CoA C-acyltransferase [Microcella sp.]|uniref:acetyl-CoA C-acyltransferase n=1 Tax=Microcella sp. TaxID=1913979 RepID=UPI0024C64782|nr:acetyl-CoA C-acyltransferase [Microcella sp.]UYN83644.1 MAG: acetyl-CoA C-acyltransferase [Microcella sp.]